MMRYVVFAVVLATLLSDAVSVPAQSSVACVTGDACRQGGAMGVSIINNVLYCCPQPNMGMSVAGSFNSGNVCLCTGYQGVVFTDPNFNATVFQQSMAVLSQRLQQSLGSLSLSLQHMGQSISNSMANLGQRLSAGLANMFG